MLEVFGTILLELDPKTRKFYENHLKNSIGNDAYHMVLLKCK